MSIKYKMLLPMLLITLVAAGSILGASVAIFSGYVTDEAMSGINTYQRVLKADIEQLKESAKTTSSMIASDTGVQEAFAKRDREALVQCCAELMADTSIEFCTLLDMDGNVVLRAHEPDNFGDSLASQKNISEAMGGKHFTGIEQGTAVKLSIRSGAPIYDEKTGKQIGVVSTGYRLDQNTFVDRMKSLLGVEVTVFLGNERVSTTVTSPDGSRAVGTQADSELAAQVLGGTSYYGKAKVLGQDAFVGYSPISGADGTIIGMLFTGQYMDVSNKAVASFLWQGGLIALILLAVAIPGIIITARRIVNPIKVMVRAAEGMSEGDVDIHVEVNTKDEMRDLANSFNKMIDATKSQSQVIERIADGDLSGDVGIRSDNDVVNLALKSMLNLNNDVFSQIIIAAQQVSSGAAQVATGAQNLAQGSTEQAASVDELSATIAHTYEQTQQNSKDTEETLAIINRAGELMTGSMASMSDMLNAMHGISDASESISKIIKVIDDIAFQTNILALNAAVEAARAGQHGKGFAVVADEVRNLAAKSATAAKETSELIEGSSLRVQEGNRIVERTNESLRDVAECAKLNAEAMVKMSEANKAQEAELSHISQGIEQIAAVVQSNTATAEESAAASEEMASQAQLLTSLVERFRLRGSKAAANGTSMGIDLTGMRL